MMGTKKKCWPGICQKASPPSASKEIGMGYKHKRTWAGRFSKGRGGGERNRDLQEEATLEEETMAFTGHRNRGVRRREVCGGRH